MRRSQSLPHSQKLLLQIFNKSRPLHHRRNAYKANIEPIILSAKPSKLRRKSCEGQQFGFQKQKCLMNFTEIILPMHRNMQLARIVLENLRRKRPMNKHMKTLKSCISDQMSLIKIMVTFKQIQETRRKVTSPRNKGEKKPYLSKSRAKIPLKLFPFNKSMNISGPKFNHSRTISQPDYIGQPETKSAQNIRIQRPTQKLHRTLKSIYGIS